MKTAVKFNQKGFAHILVIILLLVGLGVAVYLVQQKTNFFPRASTFTNNVYTFDLREATKEFRLNPVLAQTEIYSPQNSTKYDLEVFASTLQGIVNRNKPQLYLFSYSAPYFKYDNLGAEIGTGAENVDHFLYDEMTKSGGWMSSMHRQAIPAGNNWKEAVKNLVSTADFKPKGLIAWDPKVPATLNVATTIAGLGDLPVVRFDTSPDSLYTYLTKPVSQGGLGIPLVINFAGKFIDSAGKLVEVNGMIPDTNISSTKSAKNNAYLWAKYFYLDDRGNNQTTRTDPATFAYLEDGYGIGEKTDITDCTVNRDIAVKRKAFVFDLSPVETEAPVDDKTQNQGTDYLTFKSLLQSANIYLKNDQGEAKKLIEILGYVPLWDKYNDGETCFKTENSKTIVSGCEGAASRQSHGGIGSLSSGIVEGHAVKLASSYNAYFAHLCDGGTNLSFRSFAPIPNQYPAQNKKVSDITKTLENKTYITFNYSDVDGPAWLAYMVAGWKNSTKRGQIPVSWSFNPQPHLNADIYQYFYQTKSAVDYFTGGDTILGWLYPNLLTMPRISNLPSSLNLWKNKAISLFRQFNLEINGEVWNNGLLNQDVKDALVEISPLGVAGIFDDWTTPQAELEKEGLYKGMPIKNINYSSQALYGNRQQDAVYILSESAKVNPNSQAKPAFLYFRDTLHGPDYYFGLMNFIKELQKDPNNPLAKYNFEVVDPHTFFKLYKDSLSPVTTVTVTNNPVPTTSVLPTKVPTPTNTPIPTLSPTPTFTPTPTPTPSSTPTPQPKPSLGYANPESPTTTATSGNFKVYGDGALDANAVWFGAWMVNNGNQVGLNWYSGTYQGGRWVGLVDLSKHTGLGTIYVRACPTNNTYPAIDASICEDTSFIRN